MSQAVTKSMSRSKEYEADSMFIIVFLILLLAAAFMAASGLVAIANFAAIYSFYFLIIGIALRWNKLRKLFKRNTSHT